MRAEEGNARVDVDDQAASRGEAGSPRIVAQSTSGRSSSTVTTLDVARSIAMQRTIGSGRVPWAHWCTACGVTPSRRAVSRIPPRETSARSSGEIALSISAPTIKHYLPSRQALPLLLGALPNYLMAPTTKHVVPAPNNAWLGERIRLAMLEAGVKQKDLAAALGIKPQAITDMLKTGRIAKRHLPVLSELLQKPIEHWLELNATATGPAHSNLTPEERELVKLWRVLIDEQRDDLMGQIRAQAKFIRATEAELERRKLNNTVSNKRVEDAYDFPPAQKELPIPAHSAPAPKAKKKGRQ